MFRLLLLTSIGKAKLLTHKYIYRWIKKLTNVEVKEKLRKTYTCDQRKYLMRIIMNLYLANKLSDMELMPIRHATQTKLLV